MNGAPTRRGDKRSSDAEKTSLRGKKKKKSICVCRGGGGGTGRRCGPQQRTRKPPQKRPRSERQRPLPPGRLDSVAKFSETRKSL